MELRLDSSVQYVPRVGPSMAGKLKNLGINTVYDLLTYVPFRYDDFSVISKIAQLRPGETVTISGTLTFIKTFMTKNGKRLVMGRVSDATGSIDITWFNQQYLVKILKPGDIMSLSGKVDWFGQKIVLSSPVYEVLQAVGDNSASLHTGRLVPVYSETEGLSSKWLRGRIAYLLKHCLSYMSDRLPEETIIQERLMDMQEAIQTVHFPKDMQSAQRARERLIFEELFLLFMTSYGQKRLWQTTLQAPRLSFDSANISKFKHSLPFTLTNDQSTALDEIVTDIHKAIPMNRLLEGDVGAGKTVVAAGAMLAAHANGYSAVLMAPTQILAEQHHRTLQQILAAHDITVELITGGTKKKPLVTIASKPAIIVGTHAILTSDRIPKNIALIVIDEQQRFGVTQRAALRTLSHTKQIPHQLIMTATPIPRTLAQTVFGDLDLSILHTVPAGRMPVKTWVVPQQKRTSAYAWIDKELKKNTGRAFVICPLIDESESLTTVRAATSEYTRLRKHVFPERSIALLHGRMKSNEKTAVLAGFRNGTYDILVSTPVVEVGIDIPEATIIVIEAAERFGLSQLHQLRGRVGRGDKPSFCLLFTENESDDTQRRLKSLETVHNGPDLAELDLTLRGPGELLGTRQHGVSGLTLASLTDTHMISRVQKSVAQLTAKDPDLAAFPHLRGLVKRDTIEAVHA